MWGIKDNVCLILLLSSKYEIINIVGNFDSVFHQETKNIFSKNKKLTMLEWEKIFIEEPKLDLNQQILYSIKQEKVLFTITKVNETKFEYIVSITNITKCSKLGIQSPASDKGTTLIIESNKMKQISSIVQNVANVDSTVLLLGESGVGKTMFAKKIHEYSPVANNPFVSLNCASLPEELIESELFGYEHGTFTGGKKGGKKGLFEVANKGTIFLDEIAELPFSIQSKMLEVLQENTFRRIGSTENIKVDIRIIAATNRDLKQMVQEHKFRQDLYYRLNVVPITIPSLRERKEDIPYLINVFLDKFNSKYSKRFVLNNKIRQQLIHYEWPGNIRELENIIERMVVTNTNLRGEIPSFLDMPENLVGEKSQSLGANKDLLTNEVIPLKLAKKNLEKELITKAYGIYGSTYKVARALKVDQSTISKKMKEYKIQLN